MGLDRINLNAARVEGIRRRAGPAGCVHSPPAAGPGPNDSLGLFDEFIDLFAAHA